MTLNAQAKASTNAAASMACSSAPGLFPAAAVPTGVAHELQSIAREAHFLEKLERLARSPQRGPLAGDLVSGEQRERQNGVVVSQRGLEPAPLLGGVPVIALDQLGDQVVEHAAHLRGTRRRDQKTHEAQGGLRRATGPELSRVRQGTREHIARERSTALVLRERGRHAQRPDRAADAVVRCRRGRERPVVAHEVPEATVELLRAMQVAQVRGDERPRRRGRLRTIGVHRHDQRARVVVDAIAGAPRRYAVGGVLNDAGVVGHALQMIEAQLGQSAGHRRSARRNDAGPTAGSQRRAHHVEVTIADPWPFHRPSECKSRFAHPLQLRRRSAKLEQRAAQSHMVLERKQVTALVRQKLLRVPIGSGHDGCPGAHRIRQRAARDLRLVQVRAHEDIGGLQVLAQLVDRDELTAKHHVLAHAELLGFPFEHRSIGLALMAKNGGMSGAHHEVDEIGKLAHHCRQRPNHGLDALVLAQQAEGQQQAPLRYAELRLERLLIGVAIHHRNAVRDDPHLIAADAVRACEQVPRDLAHHHDLHAVDQQFLDDGRLIRRGALQHGVQRHDGRHSQSSHEIEDIAAVVAAENPVLVLHANQAHLTVVHELRGARVIGFHVLPNLELHLGGILVLTRRLGHRQHHRQRTLVAAGDGSGEIRGEGCDPAAARAVRADERHGHRALGRLHARDTLRAVDPWARRDARAIVARNGGKERH